MPDGLTHERFRIMGRWIAFPISILVPILISPMSLRANGEFLIGVGIFVGYEIGKYCTPDWDIVGMTKDEGRMMNELPVIGSLLVGISTIYGSHWKSWHRSTLTHFPFLSTAIRYFYVFWWVWFEIYRSQMDWSWLIFIFIGAFLGTSMADSIHWYLDKIKYPKSE